jgi:hypothetical protein
MIPCIIDVVSYTSIICMILLYDTPHYDQPKCIYTMMIPFTCYWLDTRAMREYHFLYFKVYWKKRGTLICEYSLRLNVYFLDGRSILKFQNFMIFYSTSGQFMLAQKVLRKK